MAHQERTEANAAHVFEYQREHYVLIECHEVHWTVRRAIRHSGHWYQGEEVTEFDAALIADILGPKSDSLAVELMRRV